jgi:heme O synthase-like polyprenyltransferase
MRGLFGYSIVYLFGLFMALIAESVVLWSLGWKG